MRGVLFPGDRRKPLSLGLALALGLAALLLATGCSGALLPDFRPTLTPSAAPPAMATATWTPPPSPTATTTATLTPTPPPTATPTPTLPPLRVAVRLDPPQVVQGRTLVVRVACSRPCALAGSLDGRPLGFASTDGIAHYAFGGVHAMAALKPQAVVLVASTADGQQMALQTEVGVLAGEFGIESITLPPATAKLLDPAITQAEEQRVGLAYAQWSPTMQWQGAFTWPLTNTLTSPFGTRRRYNGGALTYHTGTDIRGATGDPVRACADGVVALAERLQVRGNAVILDHGAGVLSGTYHLDGIAVAPGQRVAQSDLLGAVGSTGLSTGPHLHWELRVGGVAVSALEWTERAIP
ncbi:MAG: M23 family metallopeptidase [Chloroflexota bacterium]